MKQAVQNEAGGAEWGEQQPSGRPHRIIYRMESTSRTHAHGRDQKRVSGPTALHKASYTRPRNFSLSQFIRETGGDQRPRWPLDDTGAQHSDDRLI